MGTKTTEINADILKDVKFAFNGHNRSPEELVSSNFGTVCEMSPLSS
jgi:hypothetical protein